MKQLPNRAAQRGVVLAVVLILLLVMTLLAVASLSGTVLEERMSTAQVDRSLSLQAAEAALREVESNIRLNPPVMPAEGCEDGLCSTPDVEANPEDAQRWMEDGFWDDDSGNWGEVVANVDPLTATPRYIVELLADDVTEPQNCTTGGDVSLEAACTDLSSRYRITVRSADANRAVVLLQSIYRIP